MVLPHGNEIVSLLKQCYKEGDSIRQATFQLVNALFAAYGLIVVLPNNPALKKQMIPLFRDEILNHQSADIVEASADKLEQAGYKVQASGREINLFYLKDDLRNRIELRNGTYHVVDPPSFFLRMKYCMSWNSILNVSALKLPTELVPHFFRSLCETAGLNLHLAVRGDNAHHMVEGCFKAVARALRVAIKREGRDLPSTKGAL